MPTQHQFKVYGGNLDIIKEELKKLKSSGKIHSFHYDGLVESAYFGEITNMPTIPDKAGSEITIENTMRNIKNDDWLSAGLNEISKEEIVNEIKKAIRKTHHCID